VTALGALVAKEAVEAVAGEAALSTDVHAGVVLMGMGMGAGAGLTGAGAAGVVDEAAVERVAGAGEEARAGRHTGRAHARLVLVRGEPGRGAHVGVEGLAGRGFGIGVEVEVEVGVGVGVGVGGGGGVGWRGRDVDGRRRGGRFARGEEARAGRVRVRVIDGVPLGRVGMGMSVGVGVGGRGGGRGVERGLGFVEVEGLVEAVAVADEGQLVGDGSVRVEGTLPVGICMRHYALRCRDGNGGPTWWVVNGSGNATAVRVRSVRFIFIRCVNVNEGL
jgi:hypothetical protein